MPFTLRNIREDLEDIGPRFDGAPDLEFRAAHETQEEVYVVLRGSGRMKVDDEIVELAERIRARTSTAGATGGLTSRRPRIGALAKICVV